VWINLLRQQVSRRTAQLSAANQSLEGEIAERKRTENELVQTRSQHLVELERTRIARDIHDELGSTLSQIRLLSEMTIAHDDTPQEIQSNSGKISSKALEATHVLDEIVWAVDPQNDTLESLLSYLFSYASDYLSLAGVRFRIDAPTQIPHYALTTQVRHQLYMAFKETLTNIVNHAHATEVWVRVRLEVAATSFVVEDNGRGFDLSARDRPDPGASGLENMRQRFKEIGGDVLFESEPNKGTRIKFILPLAENKKS
jgi:signal transduction histidine kinase